MMRMLLLGFVSLFLCSCNEEKEKCMVQYVGLDNFEGSTVYLWRYNADKLLSDRDFGKGAMDSTIVKNGTVSFVTPEDTLHLYALEGEGLNVFFYPERGELTLTYAHPSKDYVPDKSSNPNSLNALMCKLWHEDGFPRDKTREVMFANIQNAIGCYLLDRYAMVYPDELDDIYNRSNVLMRDSTSVLKSLRRQLDATKELNTGDMYVDFQQRTFEGDTVRFSDIAGKGHPVCLFFILDLIPENRIREEMERVRNEFPDVRFIVPSYYLVDPEMKDFKQELTDVYSACWLDDSRRWEHSVRWLYRVNASINYLYLFDGNGRLVERESVEYRDIDKFRKYVDVLMDAWSKSPLALSSNYHDYLAIPEYKQFKDFLLGSKEGLNLLLDYCSSKENAYGLNAYMIDDIVQSKFPEAPSLSEQINGAKAVPDSSREKVMLYEKRIRLLQREKTY